MNHTKNSLAKNFLLSFVVFVVIGAMFYLFVFLQFGFVQSKPSFWLVVSVLIIFSFWSSAMEAAFSTLTGADNDFAKEIEQKSLEHFEAYSKFDRINGSNVDGNHIKELKAFVKQKNMLVSAHRLVSGEDRIEIVGAFATLSVFLNLSVGILLPLTMIYGDLPEFSSDSPLFSEVSRGTIIPNRTLFIFTASTIPVLLLGKIIPKSLGLNHASFWLRMFLPWAKRVKHGLGWITVGSTWFLNRA